MLMSWPISQDYNEAIQDPAACFSDPELRAGQAVVNALGIPMPRSGNFADVYEFEGARGTRWAIKCFTRQVAGLHERYRAVSTHLLQARLPFTVDFKSLPQGIRIQGQWYPIVKMQWVEGFLLNEFVRNNLERPALLAGLGEIWMRMGKRLREAGIAHADLQHGNIILVPGSRASALAVKLIDYDGMVVPALARTKSGELGHPAYQHPQRLLQGIYSGEVDRLPLLAIATALRALAVAGKPLWERYDNGDNMLFREVNLQKPDESALFKELWNLPDAGVHDLVGYLAIGLMGPLAEVPFLHEIVLDSQPRPLTAAQEQQVTALLGPGARVSRQVAIKQAVSQPISGVRRGGTKDPVEAAGAIREGSSPVSPRAAPPAETFDFGAKPPELLSPNEDPLTIEPPGWENGAFSQIRTRPAHSQGKRGLWIATGLAALIGPVAAYFLFLSPKNSTQKPREDPTSAHAKKPARAHAKKPAAIKDSKQPTPVPQPRPRPRFPLEGFKEYAGRWQVNGEEVSVDWGHGHKLVSNYPAFSTGEVGVEMFLPARGGDGDAGLILKVQDAGVGVDNFIGYGVYLSTGWQIVEIGRHRHNWERLQYKPFRLATGRFVPVVVRLGKTSLEVLVDDKSVLTYEDRVHPLPSGQIGLRVFRQTCRFRKLWVKTGGRKTTLPFGPE
jgi:hypothetical protein